MKVSPNQITCFLLEETDQVAISLRRYASGSDKNNPCPDLMWGYHNVSVYHETVTQPKYGYDTVPELNEESKRTLAFPKTCRCGYDFLEEDPWQFMADRVYLRPDTGEHFTLRTYSIGPYPPAPAGAMWFAWWMPSKKDARGSLTVRCPKQPDGSGYADWDVDGPSESGAGWTRQGEPPRVTARPSIFISPKEGGFHGWLTDGKLIRC